MLIIFFVILTIVTRCTSGIDVNLKYTTVSYTLYGEPCFNDCVNSKCIVDFDLNEKTCQYSDLPAPTYYTSLYHSLKIPKCLSRCGILVRGSSFEQCFISYKEVDYCVSDVQNNWVSTIPLNQTETQSMSFEMNADNCELHGYSDMCVDAQGIVQESDLNKSYRIMKSPNIIDNRKVRCEEECKIRTREYMECANSVSKQGGSTVICAPIAEPPPLKEIFKGISMNGCTNSINDPKSNKAIVTKNNSNILEAAVKLQNSNYFTTLIFKDDRNPVYNCTVKPSASYGDPVLPLVIRAKITSETIRPINQLKREGTIPDIVTKNLERMLTLPSDVPGTLVSHQLGGSTTMCNVVPLLPSLKEALKTYEMEIYNWVNEGACDEAGLDVRDVSYQLVGDTAMNSVYMTAVAMYENSTRPSAIGIDIAYYKGDVEDKEHTSVILCNQDSKQEAYVLNFFKRHCGKVKV